MVNEDKLNSIVSHYGDPYRETQFSKTSYIKDLRDNFAVDKEVTTAGRIVAKRGYGPISFVDISDASAKIQLYLQRDTLGKGYELFKQLDVGDIVGVKGKFFKTKTQEPTILVQEIKLLAKALRPLPEKWHGLKDIETRYRQRYLDLISNPSVRDVFWKRSSTISFIRTFFQDLKYMEIGRAHV